MPHKQTPLVENISFYKAAQGMTKNPLGIIGLFIIMVYAIAAIVISRENSNFYASPSHPAVMFLALFPLAVLVVFAWLVSKHHKHLYAPYDFQDERIWAGLAGPPELKKMKTGIATSDTSDVQVEQDIVTRLNVDYDRMVRFGFIMLHMSTTVRERSAPGNGLFKTRVWIEPFDTKNSLAEIESVTYRVWEDFKPPMVTSTNNTSSFDLWLQTYGEFPIIAIVKKNGDLFELIRHMNLPGRPMD